MNILKISEKILKSNLKRKKSISISVVVAFLITGTLGFFDEELYARDLRARNKEKNEIHPENNSATMNKSINGTDVINIVNPNSNGISHNKFIDLSVGMGNGVIFNNSTQDGVSQIGGYVPKNTNLTNSAKVILNEVTGSKVSNINGNLEVFGQRADFILANENGINVNGATFINTNGVTLTTGKVSTNNSQINFDVKKGNILLNGVGTSGDYFNVLSKTIEVHNEISPIEKEKNPDINMIAGENILKGDKNNLANIELISSTNNKSNKYGIYASELGAMYGKNIRLLSTDNGLGVKHEGTIFSDENISINSKGDIILNKINSKKNLEIKGDNLNTIEEKENSLSAEGNIDIAIKNDINLNSALQSSKGDVKISSKNLKLLNSKNSGITGENINIVTENLENNALISAKKNLNIESENLNNENSGVLKGASLDLKAKTSFINRGDIRENKKEFNEFVDENGKLQIGVTLGKFENYGNITSKNINILAQNLINSLNGKIIATDGNIIITTTVGELLNNGEIFSDKNVNILSENNIINTGKIGGDNLVVQALKGEFLNSGYISAVKELEIIANSLRNAGTRKEVENYLKLLLEYSDEKLEEVNKILKSLEGKEDLETYNKYKEIQKNLLAIKETLSKNRKLGVITSKNIKIKTRDKVENEGVILSEQKLNIEAKNLENKGILQAKSNIFIKTIENIINSGRITTDGDIQITANSYTSNGDNKIILEYLKELQENSSKNKITTFKEVGIVEGNNIFITTNDTLKNNGIILSKEDLKLNSKENVENKGVANSGKNTYIAGKNIENNSLNVGENLNIEAENSVNSKNLIVGKDINIKGDLTTNEELKANGNLEVKGNLKVEKNSKAIIKNNIQVEKGVSNFGNISTSGDLTTNGENFNFINSGDIEIGNNLNLNSKNINTGNITVGENVDIKAKENFISDGKFQAKGNIKLSTEKNVSINSKGTIVSNKNIDITANNNINNKGMIVSDKNINIKGKNITNSDGSTIWASKNINLNAENKIYNGILSTIQSGEDMTLTGKEIENNVGSIISGGKLNINSNSLVNKSNVIEDIKIEGYTKVEKVTRWDDIGFYHLDYVYLEIPNIVDNSYVKDRANISSKGELNIKGLEENGKINILNKAGTIFSSGNLNIVGDVKNTSHSKYISTEWILEHTKVSIYWETKLYGGAHGNGGAIYEGNLKDALAQGHFNREDRDGYYSSLTQVNNPVLVNALSAYLGADWKSKDKPISQDKWNKGSNFEYVTTNANGKILAGGSLIHTSGEFINKGGESGEKQDINISNGNVNIEDINKIKEIADIKQIHDVEIITGEVVIDGITIKAQSGNIAGSIAVAGTINPIIFIETPSGENGIFKPAKPNPNGIQPLFETNIDFIDPDKYYGSQYFFNQIGYDKDKTTTVIGDSYYEYVLLSKTIREGLGYTGNISANNIKSLLDNAINIQEDLKLEIGKPLTPEQIEKLDKDIVWYIEIEINGKKALVPQIYLSKKSRIEIAKNQGSGGISTVKVGEHFISDSTNFVNANGNLVVDGNIIIKSEKDILNNSSGGITGGILSQTGNVALDGNGDINLIGGRVTGDNVLISGENINIEAGISLDEKGNEIISDRAEILGNNGIQIDAKKDISIKGGNIVASGVEITPENENSMGGGITEEKTSKENIIKDVKYYEELFKKDSKDIIEGKAGTVNINAGGNINIEDIYTVSSDRIHNNIDEGNYYEAVTYEKKSNGSILSGSDININSENDVKLKGSNLITNDMLKENENKNISVGSININAKGDVDILDSQDIKYEKISEKTTGFEQGLLTIKWNEKEKNSTFSKGSTLNTKGKINISSENNIKIQGSNLNSFDDTNIVAKNNIDIIDGKDTIIDKSSESRYQVLGGGKDTSEIYSSTSKGSSIFSNGNLNLISDNNIKVINGKIISTGDTELKAKNDISIEAGKNEYTQKTSSTNIGIYAQGNIGIGGVGVSGSAFSGDMSSSGEVSSIWTEENQLSKSLDGSNFKVPTISGKPHLDQLVNSEVGFKIENTNKKIDEITWNESEFQGNNITIESGNSVDIGGGDYIANNNINIKGKKIDTTKFENSRSEQTDGFTLSIKQSQGVNSSIVDTINTGIKMDNAIKSGEADTGLLAAQGIGVVSNLVFNDLAGVYSKQSIGLSVDKNTLTETEENLTSLDGKNINITATEENITLNGVEINAEKNINLEANKNIDINSAKNSTKEDGIRVDIEAQLEESAGYSALWGGNTDIGIGGNINFDVVKKNGESFTNSKINSGGDISIKSGGDTNIIGAEVEAKNNAKLDIDGNLNIISKKSSYDEHSINANAGANVSIGGSTNTIGKAEVGFNVGGGDIWKTGETVSQSGIKTGGNLDVNVGKDLNMVGGILGSESKNGSLNVGGNLNIEDIITREQQGGAHVTISGGFTGDMGADANVGDKQDKQVTTKSGIGLNSDNISIQGDVIINGKNSDIKNVNTDIENSQVIDYDIHKKGGDLSITGSLSNIKELANKVKNKFSSKGNNDNHSIKNSDGDIILDRENLKTEDKYSVLDRDNAFDFPKDDGIRDAFIDRANEKLIVPEHIEPLNTEPSSKEKPLPPYKDPPTYEEAINNKNKKTQTEAENILREIGSLRDDISRVENIEYILGESSTIAKTKEELNQKLNKKHEELDTILKNINSENSEILDKLSNDIQSNIDNLLDRQTQISNKEKLDDRDKNKLEIIEKQLKQELDNLDKIISEKTKSDTIDEVNGKNIKENENVLGINKKFGENEIEGSYNFTDKNVDQVISIVNKELSKIRDKQKDLIMDNTGELQLDSSVENLKKAIINYAENNSDITLSETQRKQIESIIKQFEKYKEVSDKELSGQPETRETDELLTIITRSDKDIRENLKKIAEYSDNIPKEHLLDYLERLIQNSDFRETGNMLTGDKPETIIINPKITHSEASEEALNKIYSDITKTSDNSLRERLDYKLDKSLRENKEIKEILKKGEVTPENITDLANKVQDIKAEIFKEVLGADYDKVKIEILPLSSKMSIVGGNNGEVFKIYLQEGMDMKLIFETIVHELTHQDQNNLKNFNIEGFEDLSRVYKLNGLTGGYIDRGGEAYASQPVEKEAFNSENIATSIYDEIMNEKYLQKEEKNKYTYSKKKEGDLDNVSNENKNSVLDKVVKKIVPEQAEVKKKNKEVDANGEKNLTSDKGNEGGASSSIDDIPQLIQKNIDKNIAENKEFEKLYEKLEANEKLTQKERKKLKEVLDRQAELTNSSHTITEKDKVKLAKLEKELNKIMDNIKELQLKRSENLKEIANLEKRNKEDIKVDINNDRAETKSIEKNDLKNHIGELKNEKNFVDKIKDLFTKKPQVKVDENQYFKDGDEFIRTDAEIKRQLDLVLNSGKDIPAEHLQDFVAKLLLNKEAKYGKEEGKGIILNEVVTNTSSEDNARLGAIYEKLGNKFENTRDKINNELVKNLVKNDDLTSIIFADVLKDEKSKKEFLVKYQKNPEEVLEFAINAEYMKGNDLTDDSLVKLTNIVQKEREPIFEKYTGGKFSQADVNISESYNGAKAEYGDGVIKLHPSEFNSLGEALDSILHESTHLEQDLIRKNNTSKVKNEVKELYDINFQRGGYITPGDTLQDNILYQKQPVEAEAFYSMRGEEVIRKSLENLVKNLKEEQTLSTSKKEILKEEFKPMDLSKFESSEKNYKDYEIYETVYETLGKVNSSTDNEDNSEIKTIYDTVGRERANILKESVGEKQYNPMEENSYKNQGANLKEGTSKDKQKKKKKEEKQKREENDKFVLITRDEKDIKNNLAKVAEVADKLPPEHLSDYLGKVILNSEYNSPSTSKEKTTKILNPAVNNDKITVENLGKIYDTVYSKSDTNFRDNLNKDFLEKLKSNQEIKLLLQEGKVNEENLRKLTKIVGNLKQQSFKEILGKDYEKVNLVIKQGDKNSDNGGLSGNTLTLYIKPDRKLIDYLGTISHEYTHNDQMHLKAWKIDENTEAIKALYAVNSSKNGYINPEISLEGYKNQPVEKETFDLQKEVLLELSKTTGKNNNNLESNIEDTSLGKIPLIYGTNSGRKELVSVGENSPNQNNNVADSYLGKLNLGFNFIQLSEFSKKVSDGTLTENDINDIVNFKDDYINSSIKYTDRQINKVSSEANKELITEILKNEKALEILKQLPQASEEAFKNENDTKALENYNNLLKDFFKIKTGIVIDKTFENGGQIYFSLDGIVTDNKKNIDFNKLLEIYNPKNSNYDSVTSNELRIIAEKYLDNPNLKFTLGKQVIELPKEIKKEIKNKMEISKEKNENIEK